MANFECKVYKLKIEAHPNADALELAVVGDYRSIVRKGQFKTGELGVYLPEGAVLPEWILKYLGLEGKLAGKKHDRVKAIRLRNILSQGLIYPVFQDGIGVGQIVTGPDDGAFTFVNEGEDVTDLLGIAKYEPPIPTHMSGEVFNAYGYTLNYDIENIKRYPDILVEGEEVVMTEKLHGTWCCFGYHPDITHPIVTSKGLSGKGLVFKLSDINKDNLYIRALKDTIDSTGDDVVTRYRRSHPNTEPFYILGEVFGRGVQDLIYGINGIQFRVFDVYVGNPGQGHYLNDNELDNFCSAVDGKRVPVLYRGPFSKEQMLKVTDGKETVSGFESNIREGVVITPVVERTDPELGRVKLKSVSEDYLLRKGNATEYQ